MCIRDRDEVFKEVNDLSGGERVRLALAKLMLEHDNVLLLDEPTNHLDIPAKEALESALEKYDGTILFVSHDRMFLKKMATRVLEMGSISKMCIRDSNEGQEKCNFSFLGCGRYIVAAFRKFCRYIYDCSWI